MVKMMAKKVLLVLLCLLPPGMRAQQTNLELSFCDSTWSTPEGCTARSPYEFFCPEGSVQWLYMKPDMLSYLPMQFVRDLEGKWKKVQKKSIRCTVQGFPAEGFLITYTEEKQEYYKLVVWGTVRKQPVLLNIGMAQKPVNNAALSPFVRDFMLLEE
ncbi:hypothetical protein GC167_00550 [bacterium]|nr:hypothetical protein [bacterium]